MLDAKSSIARSTMNEQEHPFHGMASIRLTKARFFMICARTASNMLFVRLQHGSDEEILTTGNTIVNLQHSHISIDSQYNVRTRSYDEDRLLDGDNGRQHRERMRLWDCLLSDGSMLQRRTIQVWI